MNKCVLLKASGDALVGVIIVASVAIFLAYVIVNSLVKLVKNIFGIKNKYQKFVQSKEFLKDLKNIIEDEGGTGEFMYKMRPYIRHGGWDMNSVWSYKSASFAKNIAGKYAKPIIERILSSSIFNDFAKKEKLSSSEIESFANGLWIILSDSNFRNVYAKLLKNIGEEFIEKEREISDEEKKKFFNLN